MKTTIYELLGMIKDNKAPKRILYYGETYTYCEDAKDYVNDEDDNYSIFEDMVISRILDDEAEILETTITYKQDNTENNKQDKIGKLDLTEVEGKVYGTYATYIDMVMGNKINEIIEAINER